MLLSDIRAYIEEIGSGLFASLRSSSTAVGEISDFPPSATAALMYRKFKNGLP
jgi:hypothetical protein